MPFDFISQKEYVIEYDKLFDELNSNIPFLSDANLQILYLNQWIQTLRQADEVERKQTRDFNFFKIINKELSEAPQLFRLPINYKSGTIFIFFRVSRIIQTLEQIKPTEENVQFFNANEFVRKNSFIKWDYPDDNFVSNNNKPIIMIPFILDEYYKTLVIDGNHRIKKWIKSGRSTFPCYCFNSQWYIDNMFFSSNFSCLLYIMQNEIATLATYTIRDGINASELMNKTFFLTNKILTID